jgi:hypothetical protein
MDGIKVIKQKDIEKALKQVAKLQEHLAGVLETLTAFASDEATPKKKKRKQRAKKEEVTVVETAPKKAAKAPAATPPKTLTKGEVLAKAKTSAILAKAAVPKKANGGAGLPSLPM